MPGEWGGTATAYAASFARLCAGAVEPLLDALEVTPPASLLDVGTGTGTLARAAAARGYRTSACDPEPSMIAFAEAEGGDVRYREGGLPDLPFADRAFDAVTAGFVVNHTAHPRAAIAGLARVARDVVALTIWPRRRTELNGLWSGIVADAGAVTPPGVVLPPEADIDRSEEGLAAAMTEAGLRDVAVRTLDWDFAIDAEALWAAVAAGVATIGTTYRAQDEAIRRRMHDAYRIRAAALTGIDGLLHFATPALLGTGRPTIE